MSRLDPNFYLLDETNTRGYFSRDYWPEALFVSFQIILESLNKSLGMGRAEDHPGHQFSHWSIRKNKSKIKNKFFAAMSDSGQIRILADSCLFIHLDINLSFRIFILSHGDLLGRTSNFRKSSGFKLLLILTQIESGSESGSATSRRQAIFHLRRKFASCFLANMIF